MAQAPATVLQEINGLYVALYGRAADGPGLNYWVAQLAAKDPAITLANAAITPISTADATFLGQQFVNTQSTYFTTLYGSLNDTQFIQALYVNIGGNTGDANGIQYWINLLSSAEAVPGATQQSARAGIVGQFAQNLLSIDLTGGAASVGLSASDYAAAVARQQEYQNKVSVSQFYAIESGLPGGGILVAATTSSPAFTAAMDAMAAITSDPATVATADAAIALAVATASLNPITSLPTTGPGQTFTLTTSIDAPGTGAFVTPITGNNNLVIGTFNGTAGTNTYNTGDNIVAPLGSTGNTLSLYDQGTAGTGNATATAATVSNFSVVNVIGAEAETVSTVSGFSGLTQLNVTAVDAAIGGSTVTAVGTTNIAFTDSSTTAANTDSIQGGANVVVTETGVAAAGIISVGTTTAPTGTVAVTETTTAFGGAASAINVTGGTTITVTANLAAGTGATTNTGGAITINGSAATTAVTVNQSNTATAAAAVTGVTGVVGVTGVTAAPGVQGVTAVGAVGSVTAVTAVQGVVDGKVVINDAAAGSATAAGTITTITLNGYGTASTISDNALTTLNLNGTPIAGSTLTITDSLTVPVTSLALNLNAYNTTGTVIDATIKTLNVTNMGTSSSGGFTDTALTTLNVGGSGTLTLKGLNGNTALATVAISGTAGFSDGATTVATGLGGLAATLTSFTTTSSGIIAAALDDTTQTFVGSTGQDIITISDLADATKVITGGSATNNELILDGGAYALTAATAAKVTGFQTLGVNANVTGTIDASVLGGASFNKLDIIGNSTIAFTKVAQNAGIALDASSTSVSVKYVDAFGVSDVVAVTMGSAITATALIVSDSNLVGIGTLNFNTKAAFNAVDTITTLTDNGLANLNVSGTGGLTIGTLTEATTQATVFTINNTETNAAGVTISAFTDANLGSLIFTGSNASTITSLSDSGAVVSITNTGTSTASVGTLTDNLLTSLTLGAGVSLGQAATANTTVGLQDTSTAGITISGAADNAHVTVTLAGATTGNTDNITLGNGNDLVTDSSIATTATVNVTVGTGSNLLLLGTAASSTDPVFNVSLGTHTATTGIDSITVNTGGANYATVANVVITGAAIGDILTFGTDGASSAAALTATAAGGTVGATITAVEASAHALGAHGVAYSVFGGNTYVAETVSGTLAANDTTIIEIVGTHTFTAAAGHLTILT